MASRERDVLLIVGTVLIAVLLVAVVGGGMMGGGMMGPGMWGWDGRSVSPWWGIGMMVFWVVVIAGIAFLALWMLRSAQTPYRSGSVPLDILKERYARGEITREQFEQMRQDLGD